jgi:hypothetical protein
MTKTSIENRSMFLFWEMKADVDNGLPSANPRKQQARAGRISGCGLSRMTFDEGGKRVTRTSSEG